MNLYQLTLFEHQRKLSELFDGVNTGKLITGAVPMLGLSDIELILENNVVFKNTVYNKVPELLLRLGELVLINAQESNFSITLHLILAAPCLETNSLHQTYHPTAVPIMSKNDSQNCLQLILPEVIFAVEGQYFTADVSSCTLKNDIYLCVQNVQDTQSPSVQSVPCLDGDFEQCVTKITSCESKLTFTKSGALVFSKKEVLGFRRPETLRLSILSSEDKHTHFFPWNLYSMIQADYKTLHALDYTIPPNIQKWKTPLSYHKLLQKIEEKITKHHRENTTRLYQLLEDFKPLILEDYQPFLFGVSKKTVNQTITYITVLVTVLTTVLGITVYCIKKRKLRGPSLKTMIAMLLNENLQQQQNRQAVAKLTNSPQNPIYMAPLEKKVPEIVSAEKIPTTSAHVYDRLSLLEDSIPHPSIARRTNSRSRTISLGQLRTKNDPDPDDVSNARKQEFEDGNQSKSTSPQPGPSTTATYTDKTGTAARSKTTQDKNEEVVKDEAKRKVVLSADVMRTDSSV